jgi:HAD superfamily hydrolase (TIGR01509 family)
MEISFPKLVIFDLDGVLIDSKDIHFRALNKALHEYGFKPISLEDHVNIFDGLSTKQKLDIILSDRERWNSPAKNIVSRGGQTELFEQVLIAKQKMTNHELEELKIPPQVVEIIFKLKQQGCILAIASNSIRSTINTILQNSGITFFDYIASNEDVKNPKPHPEIYWKCMIDMGIQPQNTVIVEDSRIGRQGAYQSGATVIPVKQPTDLDIKLFHILNQKPRVIFWEDPDLNILIPMAGLGSRFKQSGFTFPKPLIDVFGKPMIERVVENLNLKGKYIFIVRDEDAEMFNLDMVLPLIAPGCSVLKVNKLTEGAACTALLARELINSNDPLIIANSDQIIEWSSLTTMYSLSTIGVDGAILTFQATHPKWSYVKTDLNNFIVEVAEKKPISTNASVGVYYFKHGKDFVSSAEEMIQKNIRTHNEFYICPVYNEMILKGKKILNIPVNQMWGLGTPEDLNYFLSQNDLNYFENL